MLCVLCNNNVDGGRGRVVSITEIAVSVIQLVRNRLTTITTALPGVVNTPKPPCLKRYRSNSREPRVASSLA